VIRTLFCADTPVFKLLVRNGSLPCSLRGSLWQTLLGTSPFFDPHYHRLVWTAEDLKGVMKKQTALTVSDLVEMFKPIAIRTDGGKRDQFDVASYLKPLDPTQSHELRFEFPLSPQSVDLFDDRSPRSEASPSPSDQPRSAQAQLDNFFDYAISFLREPPTFLMNAAALASYGNDDVNDNEVADNNILLRTVNTTTLLAIRMMTILSKKHHPKTDNHNLKHMKSVEFVIAVATIVRVSVSRTETQMHA